MGAVACVTKRQGVNRTRHDFSCQVQTALHQWYRQSRAETVFKPTYGPSEPVICLRKIRFFPEMSMKAGKLCHHKCSLCGGERIVRVARCRSGFGYVS